MLPITNLERFRHQGRIRFQKPRYNLRRVIAATSPLMMADLVMKHLVLPVIDSPFGLNGFFRACGNSTLTSATGFWYVLFQLVQGVWGELIDTIVAEL